MGECVGERMGEEEGGVASCVGGSELAVDVR